MISSFRFNLRTLYLSIRWLPFSLAACSGISGDTDPGTGDGSIIGQYLPDTGQTTSYTTTFGEDADFNLHTPAYSDNQDGTITDLVTGLMWQKQDGGEMSYEKAVSYCKTVTLGGHSDWRLPTTRELFGINHFDKVNPALPTTYFITTTAEYWWTSEKRADNQANAWVINAGGGTGPHPVTETISSGGTKHFHTRVVRNTISPKVITTRYKDNGDSTITDLTSGLTWQKYEAPRIMTWEEALQYANTLRLTGKNDWRVPNIKELQSLNDPALAKPSIDRIFNVLSATSSFWSSTSLFNLPTRAWELNMEVGIVSYSDKVRQNHLRCVRTYGN